VSIRRIREQFEADGRRALGYRQKHLNNGRSASNARGLLTMSTQGLAQFWTTSVPPRRPRHIRPLPSTGNHGGSQGGSSSWIDVDSIFDESPRVTSPHPYASQSQSQPQATRPSTAGSGAQSNSQQSLRQATLTPNSSTLSDSVSSDIPSNLIDSTVV